MLIFCPELLRDPKDLREPGGLCQKGGKVEKGGGSNLRASSRKEKKEYEGKGGWRAVRWRMGKTEGEGNESRVVKYPYRIYNYNPLDPV